MAEEQIQSQPQGDVTPTQEVVGGDQTPKGGEPQNTSNTTPVKSPEELQADFLKSLGVNSIEDAQNAIKGFKDFQDSQKTEQEKQQEAFKQAQEQLTTKDATINSLTAQITAFKKGVNPDAIEDVIKLASGADNVEEAIDNILKKYPHFGQQAQVNETPKPTFGQPQYNEPKQSTEVDNWLSAFKRKR